MLLCLFLFCFYFIDVFLLPFILHSAVSISPYFFFNLPSLYVCRTLFLSLKYPLSFPSFCFSFVFFSFLFFFFSSPSHFHFSSLSAFFISSFFSLSLSVLLFPFFVKQKVEETMGAFNRAAF